MFGLNGLDEQALCQALASGTVPGAALDILSDEPDVDRNPLVAYARDNDNLLIVPHIGGNTVESFDKTEIFLADKLVQVLAE